MRDAIGKFPVHTPTYFYPQLFPRNRTQYNAPSRLRIGGDCAAAAVSVLPAVHYIRKRGVLPWKSSEESVY